jgi:predicted nucleotidyltransferase
MANGEIIETVKRYADKLKKFGVLFDAVYLFGSRAKGKSREDSDIDVAVVSSDLNERYDEGRFNLWKLRRDVDLRIEPHGFTPKMWADTSDPMVYEIKSTGLKIA